MDDGQNCVELPVQAEDGCPWRLIPSQKLDDPDGEDEWRRYLPTF